MIFKKVKLFDLKNKEHLLKKKNEEQTANTLCYFECLCVVNMTVALDWKGKEGKRKREVFTL